MEFVEPIKGLRTIRRIKNYLRVRSARDYCLFTLGINVALRISDLLSLRVKDVENKEFFYIRESKTNNAIKVAIPINAQEAVSFYLDKTDLSLNDFLFPGKFRGRPLTRQAVHLLIKQWTEANEIEGNFSTHSLRKTWARSAIYDFNIPITDVSHKLGHSSVAVTKLYLGITQSEINKVEMIVNL